MHESEIQQESTLNRGAVPPAVLPARRHRHALNRRTKATAVEHPRVLRVLAAVFVAASFFDNFVLFDIQFLKNVSSLIGLALLGFYICLRRSRIALPYPGIFFLLFVGFTAASELARVGFQFGTVDLLSLARYLQYVQVAVFYFIVLDIARDRRVIPSIAAVFLVSTTAMSLLTLFGVGISEAEMTEERFGVIGLNLNRQAFMYTLSSVGVLCWVLGRWPRFGRLEVSFMGAALSCLFALVMTGSRGGTVALVLGGAVAMLVFFGARRIGAYVAIIPMIALAAFLLLSRAEVLEKRFKLAIEAGEKGMRDILFWESVHMFKERPVLGWGGTYTFYLGARVGKDGFPIATHNLYMEILVAFGLVGFIPWLLGLLATARSAWRCRSHLWGATLFTLLCSSLIYGWVDSLGSYKFFWLLLALIGGLRFNLLRKPAARRAVATTTLSWKSTISA